MNKIYSIIIMMLLSASVYAQKSVFRHVGDKARKERKEAKMAKMKAVKADDAKASRKAGAVLEEGSELDNDRIYRYVYGFNKDKERTSETVYLREKEGDKWGDERLLTKGTYTYEYDGQGRIKTKTVNYTENDYFTSYCIMVEYNEYTTYYTKYKLYDGQMTEVEKWGYWDNGQMSRHTLYDYGSLRQEISFRENGSIARKSTYGTMYQYSGETNDSTILVYEDNEDSTEAAYFNYKYDPATGKLLQYIAKNQDYNDDEKFVYTYDELGRITSIKQYNADDDTADIPVNPLSDTSDESGETKWVLDEEETYTYLNGEVYGADHPMRAVFGFEGPVKKYSLLEKAYYDGEVDWHQEVVFNYDQNGKLLEIVNNQISADPGDEDNTVFTVDSNGQLVAIESKYVYYNGIGDGADIPAYETYRTDLVWKDGKIVSQTETSSYSYNGETTTYTDKCSYVYGDNSVTMKESESDGITYNIYTEEKDGRWYQKSWTEGGYNDEPWICFREVQTEDVKFKRPNVLCDIPGFAPDSTIIASVKDRVVVYNEGSSWGDSGYGWTTTPDERQDLYANVCEDSYFSISHKGNQTICSNVDGLPVYVLENGRLVKEYKYWREVYNVGGGPVDSRAKVASAIPQDQDYEETSYVYNQNGLLTNKIIRTVEENRTKVTEIKLEYKYDTSTGIAAPEISGSEGVKLNDRHIGIAEGQAFCVCTLDGVILAQNATSYTFPKQGVYIIKVGTFSMKVCIQ